MTEAKPEQIQKRKHYRVVYPPMARPKLVMWGQELEVIDISENGIKFISDLDMARRISRKSRGKLILKNGNTIEVEGVILRIQDEQTILYLSRGIPYHAIVAEQRYLLSHYAQDKVQE